MTPILLVLAVVLAIVAGVLAWPAHSMALLCFAVAALAGAILTSHPAFVNRVP